MSRTLYVIGTSGFAKEVAQLAHDINEAGPRRWQAIEYLAEHEADIGRPMPFGAVTATDAVLAGLATEADVAIGIGRPGVRRAIAARLRALPRVGLPNLVHPHAAVHTDYVRLGVGNVITRGVVFTCDIRVGDFNVFNLNSTLGHDAVVGSYNVVNPGCNLSGGITLGDACLLGTGSQVLEGLGIASESVIGAGALVARSIDTAGVYVGVPARPIK